MPFKSFFLASVLSLFFSGCASMQEAYLNEVCNEHGGYQKGMNDALESSPMDQSFLQQCPPDNKEATQKGYREGYTAGRAAAKEPAPGKQIHINIGGNGKNPKAHYCELKAFTDDYSAWGSTELEAQVKVKKKCVSKHDEMFCKDFKCRGND